MAEQEVEDLIDLLRRERVGGSFWAPQPSLPLGRDILLNPKSRQQADEMIRLARAKGVDDRCFVFVHQAAAGGTNELPELHGPADPWHMADVVAEVWTDCDQELALVAAMLDKPVLSLSDSQSPRRDLAEMVRRSVCSIAYHSPFDGRPMDARGAVELLGNWRRLIDSNRDIAAVLGIAAWKRPTVDGLLWNGAGGPPHVRRPPASLGRNNWLAVWAARTTPAALDEIATSKSAIVEIEDGMIRGPGLGANCVPPLSLVVDRRGIYFDPSKPSDLETILESADIDGQLLDRAARLRRRVVELGVTKYDSGRRARPAQLQSRQVLVVGQVEDDRSVMSGGGGQSNLALLERARQLEPDAWLIYRPHPDVEAGHRKGHVADEAALRFADQVERGWSITDLIEAVDELHCITSLAGFEALLRGKAVTAHGVPFYSGWGLTRDLVPVPARRSRRRSIDELVAATLILYPRYIDPVTRLPCQPEVLVERIAGGEAHVEAPLAGLRSLQGKLNLAIRRIREAVA
ncbi:MAG: beta-3-deoxy-D-manno-oct-2-ulosonic acid transferase [Pseudomonadota bacterium]|nr:beta-3-deoxy-D-manno-oct-2-ulosonic acid transferase [Pseudomonadota bacterium]